MKYYLKTITYIILIFTLCVVSTAYASSASFFITKSVNTIQEGGRVTLDIRVKSADQAINAVSGKVIFPSNLLKVISASKDNSILNIWTHDLSIQNNQIPFEGVIINPGYIGDNGLIFNITFEAKSVGTATVYITDGSILANDGKGTNILSNLIPITFNITNSIIPNSTNPTIAPPVITPPQIKQPTESAIPIITNYSPVVNSKDSVYIEGVGEPNATTKISFNDISHKSLGEQFMDYVQYKKKKLSDIFLENNDKGFFQYVTPGNLVAGVYSATPSLVDTSTNTDKSGTGVQLLVNNSKIIKWLIIFINILILLIPIVALAMFIYFIPWYSSKRMRILRRKMSLEEEKIEINQHELEHQDELISHNDIPRPGV
ncbi:MAG: hypothetical protein KGI58_03765 [Patescibacteria group bacterium]|nr:hypothetical protein [Patescibacteria group bacterium]